MTAMRDETGPDNTSAQSTSAASANCKKIDIVNVKELLAPPAKPSSAYNAEQHARGTALYWISKMPPEESVET